MDVNGRKTELEIEGDWLGHNVEIKERGRVIASVSRKWLNVRDIVWDKQTVSFCLTKATRGALANLKLQYYVTVAPNVDLSLIAATCVSLDEREEKRKS